MGVERRARLDPVEGEFEADITAQRGQALVAGTHLIGAHAVLGREQLVHRLRATSRRMRIQLEGTVHHGDGVTVCELVARHMQPAQAEGAPGTREIGPDVYLHG